MQSIKTTFLAVCLSFFSFLAHGESAGRVEALQMPAWVQQAELKKALKPGTAINTGDIIITGKHGRVLIKLNEGSQIRIGSNSRLDFDRLEPAEEEGGYFEAVIRLLAGVARFTTTDAGLGKLRSLNIQLGEIMAKMRGGDIWASSGSSVDNLLLIDGVLTANREGEPDFKMSRALSWYSVPHEQPAHPVQPIPQNKLVSWTGETELLTGEGVVSSQGVWVANLMSLKNKAQLTRIRLAMARQGYGNSMQEIISKGSKWYRLHIKGFQTRADAHMFAKKITGQFGIGQPWISRF